MALGKSLGEIRNLPAPEVRLWRLYYEIEPWGFHDDEYRTAALMMIVHNSNITKRSQAKKVKDFMRDMPKEVQAGYNRLVKEQQMKEQMKSMTREEKIAMISKSFLGGG